MRTVAKITKRLNEIMQEYSLENRHIEKFSSTKDTLWQGTKRYAH